MHCVSAEEAGAKVPLYFEAVVGLERYDSLERTFTLES